MHLDLNRRTLLATYPRANSRTVYTISVFSALVITIYYGIYATDTIYYLVIF
jgi:hypothetical protein